MCENKWGSFARSSNWKLHKMFWWNLFKNVHLVKKWNMFIKKTKKNWIEMIVISIDQLSFHLLEDWCTIWTKKIFAIWYLHIINLTLTLFFYLFNISSFAQSILSCYGLSVCKFILLVLTLLLIFLYNMDKGDIFWHIVNFTLSFFFLQLVQLFVCWSVHLILLWACVCTDIFCFLSWQNLFLFQTQ